VKAGKDVHRRNRRAGRRRPGRAHCQRVAPAGTRGPLTLINVNRRSAAAAW
jgi:hypothetical protein